MVSQAAETSMALGARLDFVADALRTPSIRTVLDIGCGTGEFMTAPLAQQFPNTVFLGVDSDDRSLSYAREKFKSLTNLSWSHDIPAGTTFDAVIASEVIEHVEDPVRFLEDLKKVMHPQSILITSLPNGYGCHEMMSTLEALLQVTGVIPGLKILLGRNGRRPDESVPLDTLAISPHINFFSYTRALRFFREGGFAVSAYRGRMFLYNFIASLLIDKSPSLVRWNISMGRRLPPVCVADWMFVLQNTSQGKTSAAKAPYRRNTYEKLKLRLNCKRWKISVPDRWLA